MIASLRQLQRLKQEVLGWYHGMYGCVKNKKHHGCVVCAVAYDGDSVPMSDNEKTVAPALRNAIVGGRGAGAALARWRLTGGRTRSQQEQARQSRRRPPP